MPVHRVSPHPQAYPYLYIGPTPTSKASASLLYGAWRCVSAGEDVGWSHGLPCCSTSWGRGLAGTP